jgi:hypothetical protein
LEEAEMAWHGYHAFRRGLATDLRALNVDDLTIMEILRHSDVAVTRASYIKRVSAKSVEAMGRLEAEIRKPVRSAKEKTRKADTVVSVGMASFGQNVNGCNRLIISITPFCPPRSAIEFVKKRQDNGDNDSNPFWMLIPVHG